MSIGNALVIGGGYSGMTAAIMLRRAGIAVTLIEIDPDWRTYGAGISLNGATFRLFAALGIMEAFDKVGASCDGVHMRAGPQDAIVVQIPTPPMGPGIPGSGGVMRPVLARILADRVRAEGTDVRLGVTFTAVDPDSGQVRFSDGTTGAFDLIVGADGFASSVRKALFPDAPTPRYVGQAVWRAVIDRPADLPTVTMWMGPRLKAGVNGVSARQSYLFLTEDRPVNERVPEETFLPTLRALLQRFPSPILQRIAGQLGPGSAINFRPLENLLMPRPWSTGRVVLIGDAVHATTPHMAAGALLGMEDAVVLAEEVAARPRAEALAAFEDRRFERCRLIVENSGRLAEIEVTG
ncbi:MAG: FAD-dependent oxidoreductase, partial [Rhodobacteraceae bacterium]|nr:FAD-dependent oxidoreductase [Paracoccaceae bacterium]